MSRVHFTSSEIRQSNSESETNELLSTAQKCCFGFTTKTSQTELSVSLSSALKRLVWPHCRHSPVSKYEATRLAGDNSSLVTHHVLLINPVIINSILIIDYHCLHFIWINATDLIQAENWAFGMSVGWHEFKDIPIQYEIIWSDWTDLLSSKLRTERQSNVIGWYQGRLGSGEFQVKDGM